MYKAYHSKLLNKKILYREPIFLTERKKGGSESKINIEDSVMLKFIHYNLRENAQIFLRKYFISNKLDTELYEQLRKKTIENINKNGANNTIMPPVENLSGELIQTRAELKNAKGIITIRHFANFDNAEIFDYITDIEGKIISQKNVVYSVPFAELNELGEMVSIVVI